MRLYLRFLAVAVCLSFTACGFAGRPAPGTPYLATKLCGFVFDGRTGEARFSIDFTVRRPLPAGGLLEVAFENPLDRDRPVLVTRELEGGERELRVLSTPVKGITQREYAMVARVYASRDRSTPLATHTESCRAPFGQGEFGVQYR